MLSTHKVEHTYTISDFIELGRSTQDIDYNQYTILANPIPSINPDFIIYIAQNNVLYEYEDELKTLSFSVEMSLSEWHKYKYKPKLLSFDLYGSTELYFVLLFLNGTCDIKDFDKQTIKILTKEKLLEFLEAVYNAESKYINLNRTNVGYVENKG